MSWQYLTTPNTGTVFLEWISRGNSERNFPSDGYVWADPETTYRQEFNGYTIEMLVHQVGFRPSIDQIAGHTRTRFHFIAKNPGVNAPPPDPSLWIVHYGSQPEGRGLDIRQISVPQQARGILQERKWLESQGRLERKDFMLHDREHWPQINIPSSMHQGPNQHMYQQQQMMQAQRQGFPAHPNYPMQQPPAKRARHSGPSHPMGMQEQPFEPAASVEDEENTSLGDFFDHLSPREISAARYMQHHRWMEEVFSSPYASSRIVPPDLGLGLMGELKGLTQGIVNPPSVDDMTKDLERPVKPDEAQPFSNLKKEQIDEFSKRVEQHLEEGQAEIERMMKEHAEKMAEWRKAKTVMQAEKRLRYATWEGHEDAVPAFRLDIPAANGHAEDAAASTDTVEDIVKEVESIIGGKIEGYTEANMVEKGGLTKEETPVQQTSDDVAMNGSDQEDKDMLSFQQQPAGSRMDNPNDDGTPSAPQSNFPGQPQLPPTGFQQNMPQSQYGANPFVETPMGDTNTLLGSGLTPEDQDPTAGLIDMDGGDDVAMMDDMGMDVDDTGEIDFIEHSPQIGLDETGTPALAAVTPDVPATVEDIVEPPAPVPEETVIGETVDPEEPVTLGETGQQDAEEPGAEPSVLAPVTDAVPPPAAVEVPTEVDPEPEVEKLPVADADTTATLPTDEPTAVPVSVEQSQPQEVREEPTDIFDDGTFDDLAGVDGGDDDADDGGLLDFEGGMGMDDSAFGEAMAGMDATDDSGTPGGAV